MRVSLVCISLRGGGTERVVCRLANYLASKHEVAIVTLAAKEAFFPLDSSIRVLRPELPEQGGLKLVRLAGQLKHLYLSCKRTEPEICLVFGEDIAGVATLVSRLAGVRKVWVFFRGTPARSLDGLNGFINPRALRLAERLFVQTKAGFEALANAYSAKKLMVWPNPLETPDKIPAQSQRRNMIVNIGSIGRLKNQGALLRIFEQLESPSHWRLLFVGHGPNRSALEAQAAASHLRNTVEVGGERKDVSTILEQAAIFAFTSLSEGFPNALAEAMAAGCACISYDCPTGPSELIEHGVNGFLVELGDEAEYARLLQRLIDDGELRAEFSRNARESMKRFEAGMVMERLGQMIEGSGQRHRKKSNDVD